jgi:hypothetical protein
MAVSDRKVLFMAVTIKNALSKVSDGPDAIEAWEFHTRIGLQPSEAKTLLIEPGAAYG